MKSTTINTLVCATGGLLFAIGWLLIIDGYVATTTVEDIPSRWLLLFPLTITLAFGILSLFSRDILTSEPLFGSDDGYGALRRAIMMFLLAILFGCWIGSILVFAIHHAGKVTDYLPTVLQPIGATFILAR